MRLEAGDGVRLALPLQSLTPCCGGTSVDASDLALQLHPCTRLSCNAPNQERGTKSRFWHVGERFVSRMSDPIEMTIRALSSESEKVGRTVSLVSQTKRASGVAAISASNPRGGITKPDSGQRSDSGAWKHDMFEEKAAAIASGKRVVLQRPAGDLRNFLVSDRVEAIIDAHNSGRIPTAADKAERWGHDKYVGKDLRDQIGGRGADHRAAQGARVVVRPDGKKITRKGRGNFTAGSSMDD